MALSHRNVQAFTETVNNSVDLVLTNAYTVGAGAELLIVDVFAMESSSLLTGGKTGSVVSVTYGGVALSLAARFGGAGAGANDRMVESWQLTNPTPGTADIVVTLSAQTDSTAVVVSEVIGGVDLASPVGPNIAATEGTTSPMSGTLSSTVDASLIHGAAVGRRGASQPDPFTVSAGNELADGNTGGGANGDLGYLVADNLTTTTGSYSITASMTNANNWALVAWEIKPAQAVSVPVPAGSLTLTGFAPSVEIDVVVAVPLGELELTGFAPTVSVDPVAANVTVDIPAANLHPLVAWEMDDNAWLGRGSALTGVTDSKSGILNVVLKLATGSDGVLMPIFGAVVAAQHYSFLYRDASNKLILHLRSPVLADVWVHELADFNETNYPDWVNIQISWDMAATTGHFYVDGVAVGTSTTGPNDLLVELDGWNSGFFIGADVISNDFLFADMARFFFQPGSFQDFSDADARAQFAPGADLGDGNWSPAIWFQLNQWQGGNEIRNRGSGGAFTGASIFTLAGDSPTDGQVGEGLTLSGFAPTVINALSVFPPAGQLVLTGLAPEALLNIRVSPDAGALSLTGLAPTILTPVVVGVPAGSLELTGQTPDVEMAALIEVPLGELVLEGHVPFIEAPQFAEPGAGALSLTAFPPTALLAPFYQDLDPSKTDFYVDKTAVPGAIYTDIDPSASGEYVDK